MKYAFMSFSCPELSLDELLNTARRYGYDGVEPRIESRHAHGIEMDTPVTDRAVIRRKAEDSGIALCCIATSRKYADPNSAGDEVARTLRCIDLAADIGAPRLRVFGGAIPDGVSREDAVELVATSLGSVADYARQRGVTVCLETHDHWCDPADVAAVMKHVNQDAIAVNWDIMHPARHGHAIEVTIRQGKGGILWGENNIDAMGIPNDLRSWRTLSIIVMGTQSDTSQTLREVKGA